MDDDFHDKVRDYIQQTDKQPQVSIDLDTYDVLANHDMNLNLIHRGAWIYDAKINSPHHRKFLQQWKESMKEIYNL